MLPRIRQFVNVPVGVGFGIRDAATAKAIGKVADAVVIGPRLALGLCMPRAEVRLLANHRSQSHAD